MSLCTAVNSTFIIIKLKANSLKLSSALYSWPLNKASENTGRTHNRKPSFIVMDWEGLKLLIWINLLFAGKVDKHYWLTGLTENRLRFGLPKMFTAIRLYVRWFKNVHQDDNGSIHNILKAMTFHLFVGPPVTRSTMNQKCVVCAEKFHDKHLLH